MKKLVSFFIALLICVAVAMPVFADVGGPGFQEYEAYVSNPLGAECYDRNDWLVSTGVLPRGMRVTVQGEYAMGEQPDDMMAVVAYTDLNEEAGGYVRLSDLSKFADALDKSAATEEKNPYTVIVIDKAGVSLRKGPAESYAEVANIKYGTKFTCRYVLNEAWAFINYEGKEGWVFVYRYSDDSGLALCLDDNSPYDGRLLITGNDVHMAKTIGYDAKEYSQTIPFGTELTFEYYIGYVKFSLAYVKYNGTEGWLRFDEVYGGYVAIHKTGSFYVAKEGGLPLYANPDDYSSKTMTVVPAGTFLESGWVFGVNKKHEEGATNIWVYVSYNGAKGWIENDINTEDSDYVEKVCQVTVNAQSWLPLYDKPNYSGNVVANVPYGETAFVNHRLVDGEYRSKGSTVWESVKYGDVAGWTPGKYDADAEKYIENYDIMTYYTDSPDKLVYAVGKSKENETREANRTELSTAAETVTTATAAMPATQNTTAVETTASTSTDTDSKPISPMTIIIGCIAGAIVLAVTAAVAVMLINRKKQVESFNGSVND